MRMQKRACPGVADWKAHHNTLTAFAMSKVTDAVSINPALHGSGNASGIGGGQYWPGKEVEFVSGSMPAM